MNDLGTSLWRGRDRGRDRDRDLGGAGRDSRRLTRLRREG